MAEPFQLLEDCPDCRVEGAVVALFDPQIVEGVAVEATCRLCGRHAALGDVLHRGVRFGTVEEVVVALRDWSTAEGEPDLEAFCAANLGGVSAREVGAMVLRGEPVSTSFDVVAFLFPGMAAALAPSERRPRPRGSGRAGTLDGLPGGWPGVTNHDELPGGWPELPEPPDPEAIAQERLPARALAAVMLADGEIRAGERRFLDAFLVRTGLSPATEDDLRAWRPGDLPRPAEPEPLLRAMVELAHIDKERDGSEWRVVRAFARSWGYPLAELEKLGAEALEDTAPPMKKLWTALSGLFVRGPR
jgi:hypothetical protein